MAEDLTKIQKVSPETRNAVARKSAQTLPNRPSEQGYSADEIKRRFYQPILDATNSALAEIDRVVDEANGLAGNINEKLDDFMGNSQLIAPFKRDLDETVWQYNQTSKLYEDLITKEMHSIQDYKEICVNMFLFGAGGKLINCNNYSIYTNGDVRLYNENTGGGFVVISRNRDGFVKVETVIDVNNVLGLGKVAKTNNYNDLDNLPNFSQMARNEEAIAKIISGAQQVYNAKNAENAVNASYAASADNAANAVNAQSATRASQDGNGANIANSYAKQSGTYLNVTVGRAYADEDGSNLKSTYAKQVGTYSGMTVGKAANADNATNAVNATNATNASKATQDGNGANIAATYATKTEVASYESVAKQLNPVGSILFSANNVNPQTYIPGTTWAAWGSGRVPVGISTGETEFNTTEKTGGSKTQASSVSVSIAGTALTVAQLPPHRHRYNAAGVPYSGTFNDSQTVIGMNDNKAASGNGGNWYPNGVNTYANDRDSSMKSSTHTHTPTVTNSAVNNLQPYITCYMWKRTA